MSVTVLVTQARFSLPGGKPWVELSRFLVSSFQFSFGISILLFNVAFFSRLKSGSHLGEAMGPALPRRRHGDLDRRSFKECQTLYDLLREGVRSRDIREQENNLCGQ